MRGNQSNNMGNININKLDQRVYLPTVDGDFGKIEKLMSLLSSQEQINIKDLGMKIRRLILCSNKITKKGITEEERKLKIERKYYEGNEPLYCRAFLFLIEGNEDLGLEYIRLYKKAEKILPKWTNISNSVKGNVIKIL